MRLLRIFMILAALVLIPFFIWGEKLMALFDGDAARAWILSWGSLGGFAVFSLLVLDLFLPIPATGVMSAAGFVFGPLVGGLISVAGSFCSGLLAYGLCRIFGVQIATRLAGAGALAENERLFQKGGPWLVALSRWLPVFPEVIACLAGLAGMPLRVFAVALLCGTLPMGFTYAAVGALFSTAPSWALALSVVLPVVLWAIFRPLLSRKDSRQRDPEN
jgi:uncharacterized membrane protein YdjX (TVP38/TMEM64 family)